MNDKTLADVLDKSIDKLSGGAAEVAKAIKSVAPHAWEVAVRQQAIEGLIGCVLSIAALVALFFATRYAIKHLDAIKKADMVEPVLVFAAPVGAGTMVYSLHILYESALQLAVPEYAAAMAIVEAIK